MRVNLDIPPANYLPNDPVPSVNEPEKQIEENSQNEEDFMQQEGAKNGLMKALQLATNKITSLEEDLRDLKHSVAEDFARNKAFQANDRE